MNTRQPQLHFDRFEFKYLLPTALCREFERELQFFVQLDPFVSAQAQQRYFVRSLYFDDPAYSAYYDKTDGVKQRAKFRLRTYTDDPHAVAPQFLEIKGRYNQLVFKHRTPVPICPADNIADHLVAQLHLSQVTQQFAYEFFRKQLRPCALIDYWRRPYLSKYDPEFRVTFDSDLHATDTERLFPLPHQRRRQLKAGYTVMEVKFKRHVPAWFHRLIQSYELRRISISKICTGLEALELVEDD